MSARAATRKLAAGCLLALSVACGHERNAGPPPEQAALGGEIAARVGGEAIPVALVVRVAASQHITPQEALARLVDDAVTADAARTRGLDREQPAAWLFTAARARFTADRMMTEARQAGPPTNAEIDDLTKRHWREVDRPPGIRVVHALTRKSDPAKPDAEADARARALAPELRAALVDARDAADFIARAKAFPRPPGVKVVAEKLPPFVDDGYSIEGGDRFDLGFTKGAFAIGAAGETSAVVESSFGWHVIRLVERIPEQRMPLEARRIAFQDEVVTNRARAVTDTRLNALRAANPVEVSPSADSLTRSLLRKSDHGTP